jgi:hypothetical protein
VRGHFTCLLALALLLGGCAADERHELQSEIDALLPDGARRATECNWASGFVEEAPASLICSYFGNGDVRANANTIRRKLRGQGFTFRLVHRRPDAPTQWLVAGHDNRYSTSVGLGAPGDPLDWQTNQLPVPSGQVGLHIAVSERE